jgi:hypothetical protein
MKGYVVPDGYAVRIQAPMMVLNRLRRIASVSMGWKGGASLYDGGVFGQGIFRHSVDQRMFTIDLPLENATVDEVLFPPWRFVIWEEKDAEWAVPLGVAEVRRRRMREGDLLDLSEFIENVQCRCAVGSLEARITSGELVMARVVLMCLEEPRWEDHEYGRGLAGSC